MPEKKLSCQNLFGIHSCRRIIFALPGVSRQAVNQLKASPIPIFISFLIFFLKLNIIFQKDLNGFFEFSEPLDYFSVDEIRFKEHT